MTSYTDPYNKAILYLRNKYGHPIPRFEDIENWEDKRIRLLVGQYNLGMEPKKELAEAMKRLTDDV